MKKRKNGLRSACIVTAILGLFFVLAKEIIPALVYKYWRLGGSNLIMFIAVTLLLVHGISFFNRNTTFVLPAVSALLLFIYPIIPLFEIFGSYYVTVGGLVSAVLYLVIAIIIIARFKCPVVVLVLSCLIGVIHTVCSIINMVWYCEHYFYFDSSFVVMVVVIAVISWMFDLSIVVYYILLSVHRMKNSPKKLYARSFEARLRALQNDRSSGKLTEEEYAEKRRLLLESMNIKVEARDTFKDYGEV